VGDARAPHLCPRHEHGAVAAAAALGDAVLADLDRAETKRFLGRHITL
jgi:hypothetical protein